MSIASEKVKFSSERFLLVRINPSRYILPVINAGLYEITLPFLINRLERNGAALTEVVGTPGSDDEWNQDADTRLLRVKLASAPDDTTNILVCNYYLFYTGTVFRAISEDPEDDATPIRNWQPRIKNYPTINQSFGNILQGVFTISDTSLILINESRDFQSFLTDDDSFFNKQVDIWLCINSIDNIKKIFTGTCKSISLNQNQVTISFVDSFNKLKQPAYMGDTHDECYATLDNYPELDPKQKDKPIKFIVGEYSRYTTRTDRQDTVNFVYKMAEGNEAFCYDFRSPAFNAANKNWICCRQSDIVDTQNFGSVVDVFNFIDNVFINFSSISSVRVGDGIEYTTSLTTYFGVVCYVGNFTYLGNPYNCIISSPGGNFTLSSTVTNNKSFGIVIFDATDQSIHPCSISRDFIITDTTITSGGNRLIKIIFTGGFESNIGLIAPDLNPNIHKVMYRSSNVSPHTHAQIIKDMAELVDLPTNSASFTQAEADLSVNAMFSIPAFDEQDFKTYLEYVQDVLKSTLGFLKINSDFEVEYQLLEAPTSTDIRDRSLTIQDDTKCKVEYQDLKTTLISYNPHNSSDFETLKTPSPAETRSNPKAQRLHGVDKTVQFRHSLQTITDRIDAHIGFSSMRSATYEFSTATQDIDSELGQDVEFQNKIVLGNSQIQDVKIVTINKSPSKTSIEAKDLKGLP
jgi:hypothetical protein